eukprot:SAG31_NODE_2320_length_5943_cov_2.466975_5_plen_208_part_00
MTAIGNGAAPRLAVGLLLAAAAVVQVPLPATASLLCANEAAQLFEVDIGLLPSASSSSPAQDYIGALPTSARKICHRYPISEVPFATRKFVDAWHGLDDVSTVQFVLPAELASSIGGIVVRGRTQRAFHAYYQAQHLTTANGTLTAAPAGEPFAGDPFHLSLFMSAAVGVPNASAVMALFISFEAQPTAVDADFDHHCNITADIAEG